MPFLKNPIVLVILFTFTLATLLFAFPADKNKELPRAELPTEREIADLFRKSISEKLPSTKVSLSNDAAKKLEVIILRAAATVARINDPAILGNPTEINRILTESETALVRLAEKILEKGRKDGVISINQSEIVPNQISIPAPNTNTSVNTNQNSNQTPSPTPNMSSNVNVNSSSGVRFQNNRFRNGFVSGFSSAENIPANQSIITIQRFTLNEDEVGNAYGALCPGTFPIC